MLILKTIPHETIWGGQKLMPYVEGEFERIGHLYSVMDDQGQSNVIMNGKYKGQDFHAYFIENKERFGLGEYEQFPLIIALVEANDNLSIQVHPDDEVAKTEEGRPYGKNESWYFIDAPESGSIFDGCLCDTVEEAGKQIALGNAEKITDRLSVKSGDYVYVEAGTLHALSTGSFLYEIEENCELTYRVYDFGRVGADGKPREVHVDKALKALKPSLKSVAKQLLPGDTMEERRYAVEILENVTDYRNVSDTLECITLLKGKLLLDDIEVSVGTSIILEPGEDIGEEIEVAIMARPK